MARRPLGDDDGPAAVNKRDSTHRPLCLVTGANSGIGFETARGLARRDTRVILACRNRAKGEAARSSIASETGNPDIELLIVDLASRHSIRAAAQEFSEKHSALDVLVNNAAVAPPSRQQSPDEVELTFATNVLGYYLLTELLLSALRSAAAARVVNVASRMAYGLDLTDVEFKRRLYDSAGAYAQSKQADRMLTWAFARRLEGTSVTANAVTPGVVNTKLLRALAPQFSGRAPAEGADPVLWLATSSEVAGVSGRFWADRRQEPCEFRNRHDIEALWSICGRLSGEKSPKNRTNQ
jgi:NAD(P)-dependent dehydrogenase (short-subunit alcohol dehydrogenase family)